MIAFVTTMCVREFLPDSRNESVEGRRIGTMTLALLLALLGSLMAMGFIIRRLERG